MRCVYRYQAETVLSRAGGDLIRSQLNPCLVAIGDTRSGQTQSGGDLVKIAMETVKPIVRLEGESKPSVGIAGAVFCARAPR